MALEESVDELDKMESNGVEAYIDPKLKTALTPFGKINVDYITNELGNSGFAIRTGDVNPDCGSCGSAGASGCG
jgi:Fe-S cluster assembly iron-binding protein IscA